MTGEAILVFSTAERLTTTILDFIFQGFQSTFPVWIYLLIFAACTFFAWWSYSSIIGIRKSFRYILTGLRSAVFLILLLLLLNPFFKTERPYFTKPNILVMLDNSASTAIEKNHYQGLESYKKLLESLNVDDSTSINFDFFSFGNEINTTVPSKLTFGANETNLSNAVEFIKGNETQANAAVIITDGIYTKGENPVFEASEIIIPLFVIGLGDTTSQKDALIKSVVTNSTGYLHTKQEVKVKVSSKGFKGEPFQIRLKKGDETLQTKTVTPSLSNSIQNVTFELPLEEEGLQQFQVSIPDVAGEWTSENNTHFFSIDVRNAKQQILSIAFEIHPDVGFVRSLLLTDRHTQLTNRTWLNGDRFIEGPLSFDPDTIDLAIIHGFPRTGISTNVQKTLAELTEKVPLIVAATPKFSAQSFEREIAPLPVTTIASWQYLPAGISPKANTGHPILELPPVNFDQIPRLFAPVRNVNMVPGAKSLFNTVYRDQSTPVPMLAVQETGNKRVAIFTGFGWFKVRQSPNQQFEKFVKQLWLNVISWTATDPDDQNLEVRPVQTTFSNTEPVVINAFLKNERGEKESQASIDLTVSSDSLSKKFYAMENEGGGKYRLNIGTLPEGTYSFEATAKKENRVLGIQTGEFAVARSNAEFINTERDDQLLRQLSERTGGAYMPFDSVSGFWDRLNEQGLLDQTKKIETTFWYPYQHLSWFILVLILLSAEWIFRKYLSLP